MSGSLIIVLIIVVWLFVLAPLLLRGQKPIRRAGEAFEDTRVIHEGGSGDLPTRRRPRLTAADVRTGTGDDREDEDYEVVAVDEILLDDDRPSRSFKGMFTRQSEPAEVVDGGLVHELEPAVEELEVAPLKAVADIDAVEAQGSGDVVAAPVELDEWDDWSEEKTYAYDNSYTSPADFLYPDTSGAAEPAAGPSEDDRAEDQVGEDAVATAAEELSEEDIEFAEHRAARGGWDPVADAAYSLTRYQRRQRTLIGLAAAVVVTAILAFVVGGWTWLFTGLAVVATVVYLTALRGQVRAEQALRARRIRQLRRARLGVRNASDGELAIPRRLRRPGAVILERDDESPDFNHLPVTRQTVPHDQHRGHDHGYPYGRRVG